MTATRQIQTVERPERVWERAFLAALSQTGNVSRACAAAGICRAVAYEYRDKDSHFAQAWCDALEEAADVLEAEAWRRGVNGVDEPVVHQGRLCGTWVDAEGNVVAEGTPGATLIPLTVKRYADSLLMKLLGAARPEKYRDRASLEVTGARGGPVKMSLEDLAVVEQELKAWELEHGSNGTAIDQPAARPDRVLEV